MFGVVATSLILTTAQAQYVDLSTGKTITIVKHHGNGMMYNTQSRQPVHLYVNVATSDTFYGRTGMNINGQVLRNSNGTLYYAGDGDYMYSNGEYRLKTEADTPGYKRKVKSDGEMKVKYGDYKRKTEPNNGDVKVKEANAKVKLEADGVVKMKDSTYRGKLDSEGNFREKDDSSKTKINADGTIKVKDKREDYKGKVNEEGEVKEKEKNTKRKSKKDKEKIKKDD